MTMNDETRETDSEVSSDPVTGFRQRWLPIFLIMSGLVIWAVVHAVGAYLSGRGNLAVLKALFVLVSMSVFLGSWGVLLWYRNRCIKRQ